MTIWPRSDTKGPSSSLFASLRLPTGRPPARRACGYSPAGSNAARSVCPAPRRWNENCPPVSLRSKPPKTSRCCARRVAVFPCRHPTSSPALRPRMSGSTCGCVSCGTAHRVFCSPTRAVFCLPRPRPGGNPGRPPANGSPTCRWRRPSRCRAPGAQFSCSKTDADWNLKFGAPAVE